MVDGEFEFGFAVDWMRKDLGICIEEAAMSSSQSPRSLINIIQVQTKGGNRYDTSSLILNLED